MREIGDIIRRFEIGPDEPYALATLVRAHGSSYRRPGARMLIPASGDSVGSLSGGCLEEEVSAKGGEVIRTGKPAWMKFDTRRHFGCYGAIEIFIEPVRPALLATLAEGSHTRRSVLIATVYSRDSAEAGSRLLHEFDDPPDTQDVLVQRVDPALELLVIGKGPDTVALHRFAGTLGWHVIAIESATEIRGQYDPWTAAIIKTHNYGRDFAALRALLPLGLPYIGLLGPRRRRDQLLADLLDIGVDVAENLFAPAGLDLGGDSPESIALAIIAEINAVFAGGSAQPLRGRRTPIHATSRAPLSVAR